jgi:hypothetical protein
VIQNTNKVGFNNFFSLNAAIKRCKNVNTSTSLSSQRIMGNKNIGNNNSNTAGGNSLSINSSYYPKHTLSGIIDTSSSKIQMTFTNRNYNDSSASAALQVTSLNTETSQGYLNNVVVNTQPNLPNKKCNSQSNLRSSISNSTMIRSIAWNRDSTKSINQNLKNKVINMPKLKNVNNNVKSKINFINMQEAEYEYNHPVITNENPIEFAHGPGHGQGKEESISTLPNHLDSHTNTLPEENGVRLKQNFKMFIKSNKPVSLVNIKQKYKELLKSKNIPASLIVKGS